MIDELLRDDFTPEHKRAWISMIQHMSAYMISDNYEQDTLNLNIIKEELCEDGSPRYRRNEESADKN